MLIALGRNDDAVAELEKLIALEPRDQESPRYVYALSTAHLRAGHVARAPNTRGSARLALAYDQAALAAAIDQDLAALAAQRQRQPERTLMIRCPVTPLPPSTAHRHHCASSSLYCRDRRRRDVGAR